MSSADNIWSVGHFIILLLGGSLWQQVLRAGHMSPFPAPPGGVPPVLRPAERHWNPWKVLGWPRVLHPVGYVNYNSCCKLLVGRKGITRQLASPDPKQLWLSSKNTLGLLSTSCKQTGLLVTQPKRQSSSGGRTFLTGWIKPHTINTYFLLTLAAPCM